MGTLIQKDGDSRGRVVWKRGSRRRAMEAASSPPRADKYCTRIVRVCSILCNGESLVLFLYKLTIFYSELEVPWLDRKKNYHK